MLSLSPCLVFLQIIEFTERNDLEDSDLLSRDL